MRDFYDSPDDGDDEAFTARWIEEFIEMMREEEEEGYETD